MTDDKSIRFQKIIAYSSLFIAITWGAILLFIGFEILKEHIFQPKHNELVDIRKKHLEQHAEEQNQYERIINLLEEIKVILEEK